jgi:hypothetical protein
MGFWSSVGNIVSGVASSIGSAFSSAANWVGSAISRGLEACINIGGNILSSIASFAGDLARALGILKPEDPDTEDFGDRALQAYANGIVPEDFPDFDSYVEHLRHFELDPEKSKESSFQEKAVKGLEITGRLMEEKLSLREGGMADIFALYASVSEYFTVDRFRDLLKSGLDIDAVSAYFQKRMGGAEALDIEDALVDLERTSHPEKSTEEVLEELWRTADSTVQKLDELIKKGAAQ